VIPVEVLGEGVAGSVAALDADPEADFDGARGGLEEAFLEGIRGRCAELEEQVSVMAAAGQGAGQEAVAGGGIDRVRTAGEEGGLVRGGGRHREQNVPGIGETGSNASWKTCDDRHRCVFVSTGSKFVVGRGIVLGMVLVRRRGPCLTRLGATP